jgi:hypothetical protein
LVTSNWANLNGANIGASNINSRMGSFSSETYVTNGNSVNLNPAQVTSSAAILSVGAGANTGNAFMGGGTVYQAFAQVNAGSTATRVGLFLGGASFNGNVANAVAFTAQFSTGATANVTENAVTFYHPTAQGNTSGLMGQFNTNGVRSATNYFAFRNDDDLARSSLGSLSRFHELNANVTISSGNVTINKQNGQVQQVYMTENVSGVTFSNFVTRVQKPDGTFANQADTVTLIIQQGATPYDFALPTGNAAIRYAGGISTVTSTANTTVMVSVTGVYNYNTSATDYLVTVSPGFI